MSSDVGARSSPAACIRPAAAAEKLVRPAPFSGARLRRTRQPRTQYLGLDAAARVLRVLLSHWLVPLLQALAQLPNRLAAQFKMEQPHAQLRHQLGRAAAALAAACCAAPEPPLPPMPDSAVALLPTMRGVDFSVVNSTASGAEKRAAELIDAAVAWALAPVFYCCVAVETLKTSAATWPSTEIFSNVVVSFVLDLCMFVTKLADRQQWQRSHRMEVERL